MEKREQKKVRIKAFMSCDPSAVGDMQVFFN
jgi:hypothetical protein